MLQVKNAFACLGHRTVYSFRFPYPKSQLGRLLCRQPCREIFYLEIAATSEKHPNVARGLISPQLLEMKCVAERS